MKKILAVLLLTLCRICYSQNVPIPGTFLPTGSAGTIVQYQYYAAGFPVFGPSNLVDNGTQLLYKGNPVGGSFTLTTNGSSGAATFISGVLNIPIYSGGSSGFPIILGSTSIGSGSTTTSIGGLTVDGVSPTIFGFVDPTSSIQTQLNSKQISSTVSKNGLLGGAVFNITDTAYGGKGDAVTSTGSINVGSNANLLTDVSAPFTPANVTTATLFCINGAGAGSNGLTPYSQAIQVTAISSVSSTTQINFTLGVQNNQTLTNGTALTLKAGGTGGVGTLTNTIFYYVGSVTNLGSGNFSALLFTNPNLTGNVTNTGTGTGQMYFGDVQLCAGATYASSTTVTLTTAASTTVSGVAYTFGTNNTTAFTAAQAAVSAAGGGTIFLPHGRYLGSAAVATPNSLVWSTPNEAFAVTSSNTTVMGEGRGATTLLGGNWYGPVLAANAATASMSNIQFINLSVAYANAPGVRFGTDYSSYTEFCGTVGTTFILTDCRISNTEVYNDIQGINFFNNCSYCTATDNWAHDGHSGRISVISASGGSPQHILIAHNHMYNAGDSLGQIDCLSGSNCADITFDDNIFYNGGHTIVELIGGTGLKMTNNTARKTLTGFKVSQEPGFAAVQDVTIIGNHMFGMGTGVSQYGNNISPYPGAVIVEAPGSGSVNGVLVDGNFFDSDGTNKTINSYGGIVGSPVGTISNVSFLNNKGLGGINCTLGLNNAAWGAQAGLDFEAGTNVTALNNSVFSVCGDGYLIGSAVLGSVDVSSGLQVDTPNTLGSANKFGLNLQGGNTVRFGAPLVINQPTTFGGLFNYSTLPATTIINTFSTAGGFSAGNINTQTGTGLGATAWTGSTGASIATITLGGTNSIACVGTCTAAVPSTATINIKRRDAFASTTLGVAPTASTQALFQLASDGTNTPILVNMFNLQVSVGGVAVCGTTTGATGYTATALDILTVGLQGRSLDVWLTRSGTKTLMVDCQVGLPPSTQGLNYGFILESTTPTLTAFNVSAP